MKSYRETQRNPAKHLPSVIMVGLLHLLVGYALVTGLARTVVEVLKAPLETKIIEEIKKPPPDTPPPPPPKFAPPPPFIPPPEVNIQVPMQAQQAPTITTVTTNRPPPGPPPKAAPVAPPAPTGPVVRKNVKPVGEIVRPVFPRQAIRDGIQNGNVVAHLHIRPDGTVSEVRIVSSKPPRVFDREVIRALSQWRFAPESVGFIGEVDIDFKLTD
ncbi:MAG: energy transducer TonB [Betaproteobacteria bacterium]|nr:energy transducer TonB [Betaproteobacteria bacterium]